VVKNENYLGQPCGWLLPWRHFCNFARFGALNILFNLKNSEKCFNTFFGTLLLSITYWDWLQTWHSFVTLYWSQIKTRPLSYAWNILYPRHRFWTRFLGLWCDLGRLLGFGNMEFHSKDNNSSTNPLVTLCNMYIQQH